MARHWGIPNKDGGIGLRDAKIAKPILTLVVSAIYGSVGAAIAVISFDEARTVLTDLFHGGSLIAAILAAGFGCWGYIWLTRPRFASLFSGKGDAFSSVLRFYVRAAIGLFVLLIAGQAAGALPFKLISVLLLCMSGGAGAAAAFQTVLAFVPYYEGPETNGTTDV